MNEFDALQTIKALTILDANAIMRCSSHFIDLIALFNYYL